MKKILALSFALLLIVGLGTSSYAESNEDIEVMTAKSYSLGGAFTGIADDVSAVLFNPAGLSQSGFVGIQGGGGFNNIDLKEFEDVTKFMDDISGEVDYSTLNNSFPENTSLKMQGFGGANFKSIAISGNLKSSFDIYEENGDSVLSNSNDISGILTYASKLASPPLDIGSLAYGFNLKMAQHKYDEYRLKDDYKKSEITADANSIGIDAGALAKLTDIFSVGAQIKNLYATEYELEGEEVISTYDVGTDEWGKDSTNDYKSNETFRPKRNMRVGASVQVPVVGTTVAADLENIPPISENNDMIYHVGLQQNLFLGLFSLRAGTYGPLDDINGESSTYTAGLGINLVKFHLDAAVGSNKSGDNMSGMLSGRFKF